MNVSAPATSSTSRLIAPRRFPRQPRRLATGTAVALIGAALFFALLLGMGAATGQRLIIIGMAGLLGGVAVLAMPVTYTFWAMIVMSFVLVGPMTYFLHLSQVQWLPALMGIALTLQVLVIAITRRRTTTPSVSAPAFVFWLVLFWIAVTFSSVIGQVSVVEVIMASRYYLFVWGALFVFLVGAIDEKTISRLWSALLVISTLQLPLALYQYVFVASKRRSGEIQSGAPAWDAVIGTFPGTDTGGGNSAAMAIYLLVMIVLAVALWRHKMLRGSRAGIIVCFALATITLAEVKAAVLLLPVALGLYYRKEVAKHPTEAIGALILAVLVSIGILWGYQKLHYDRSEAARPTAVAERSTIDQILLQFDPEQKSEQTGRLARAANLRQWWEINLGSGDLNHTMIGHGMGTTQHSNIGVGSIAARYGLDIDRTTFVILLWEVGVIGLAMFLALLGSTALLSLRLAADVRIPERHRVFLRVGAIGLGIFMLTVPYKSFAVRLTSIQLLIILMIGQAFFWYRQMKIDDIANRLKASKSRGLGR